jgi:hypothetical protein
MAAPRIQPTNIKVLSTVHENFRYSIENLFNVWNGDNPSVLGGYNETTKLIQDFLRDALQKQKSVRALGGNWSWTKVGFTNNWILSTARLNRIKRTLPEEIESSFGSFEPDRLIFAQCGCSVLDLNTALQSLGRSLKTSGASNGQTIAGLISNCTHGSAIDFGSTPDFVVGLHLIVSPHKHVYLERASRPVVNNVFVQKIGAELVRDDAMFNAALVSFGSFGFIHGVMIETEPLFLYNVFRKQFELNQVGPLMDTLDFSQADFLPRPNTRPYHFQVTINPYDRDKRPYVAIMYKEQYREDYPRIVTNVNEAGPGEDAPVILGKLTDLFPVITPLIVNTTIKQGYKDIDNKFGTHGEIFTTTVARGKVLSSAMGISIENAGKVLDIAFRLNEEHSYVGVFAFRFVRQTDATLGFTKFPFTCIAEFDSFEGTSTTRFYNAIWKALEDAGIPYTFHWGKVNNLDATRVRKMYGSKVDEWITARNKLIPRDMLPVFTNEFMVQTGLDKVVPSGSPIA